MERAMPNITNNTRQTIDFVVGVRDGAAQTDSVKAGETKAIDVKSDDPKLGAYRAAGAITINASKALQKAAAEIANRS